MATVTSRQPAFPIPRETSQRLAALGKRGERPSLLFETLQRRCNSADRALHLDRLGIATDVYVPLGRGEALACPRYLARQTGISATAVRRALRILQALGRIRLEIRRGGYQLDKLTGERRPVHVAYTVAILAEPRPVPAQRPARPAPPAERPLDWQDHCVLARALGMQRWRCWPGWPSPAAKAELGRRYRALPPAVRDHLRATAAWPQAPQMPAMLEAALRLRPLDRRQRRAATAHARRRHRHQPRHRASSPAPAVSRPAAASAPAPTDRRAGATAIAALLASLPGRPAGTTHQRSSPPIDDPEHTAGLAKLAELQRNLGAKRSEPSREFELTSPSSGLQPCQMKAIRARATPQTPRWPQEANSMIAFQREGRSPTALASPPTGHGATTASSNPFAGTSYLDRLRRGGAAPPPHALAARLRREAEGDGRAAAPSFTPTAPATAAAVARAAGMICLRGGGRLDRQRWLQLTADYERAPPEQRAAFEALLASDPRDRAIPASLQQIFDLRPLTSDDLRAIKGMGGPRR